MTTFGNHLLNMMLLTSWSVQLQNAESRIFQRILDISLLACFCGPALLSIQYSYLSNIWIFRLWPKFTGSLWSRGLTLITSKLFGFIAPKSSAFSQKGFNTFPMMIQINKIVMILYIFIMVSLYYFF